MLTLSVQQKHQTQLNWYNHVMYACLSMLALRIAYVAAIFGEPSNCRELMEHLCGLLEMWWQV